MLSAGPLGDFLGSARDRFPGCLGSDAVSWRFSVRAA